MKVYSLVTPGLEDTAKEEIEQLQGSDVTSHNSVIEFSCDNPLSMARYSQSSRRIVVAIGMFNSIEDTFIDAKESVKKSLNDAVERMQKMGQDISILIQQNQK